MSHIEKAIKYVRKKADIERVSTAIGGIKDYNLKKPDTIKTKINRRYLKFFSERGIEPHYADCLIRYKDNYDTVEVRIAIGMDSDTEKDDDIFFYCDTLEDMKSLAENSCEDFYLTDCYNFGVYEDLL